MVYFVSAKGDHFSESGLLFSVVAQEEMGIDYSAKNNPMDCNILKQIRQDLYESLERGADALFNLGDSLLCESQAQSLPELSLSPVFERQWPSVYEALEDGRINVEQVRAIWVSVLLADRAENEAIWIAVDGSNIARPSAPTSADQTIIHLPNLPLVDKAGSHGWTFSTVVLVPEQTSSWTPILDQQRKSLEQTAIGVAITQLQALGPLFGNRRVIILADRWYGTPQFLRACHDLGYSVLIRLKSNRKLYRVPVRTHQRGAPRHPMVRCFRANVPRPMGLLMKCGASSIPQGPMCRSADGATCISSRTVSWT